MKRGSRGAIVLAGGRSTRMGRDKATLPFGPEPLLARVVRRLAGAVDEIVVVARPGQALPALPVNVARAEDEVMDRGPLAGLVAGLEAVRADAAFATSCDAPFLEPALVDLLFARLGDASIAVAEAGGFTHPLAAVYRRAVAGEARALLSADRLRPIHLFEHVPTVRVTENELRAVDPDLASLENLNTPEAYERALARRAPLVHVELYEVARRRAGVAEVAVEAATLGEALRALARRHPSLVPDVLTEDGGLAAHWRASVGGGSIVDDLATPLRDADHVVLVSALAGG